MNYEKRFRKFTSDLLDLIERHMKECDEAERSIYDIDEIMECVEIDLNKEIEPVIYSRKRKNSRLDDSNK